jgi:CheY-like chemotaxis protein
VLNADPVRLAQLLSNLLDNAAKYTPSGGKISLDAELEDGGVRITIGDSGIGIPQDQVGNIFKLFTQLRGSQATEAKGLGMGLALVRTLAELHGGTVDASSAGPGQGSRFTVRLPIYPDSISNQAKPTPESSLEVAVGRRILVVEDNDDIAESLGTFLAMDGHTVSIAQDGAVALDMLRTFEPEVVLLDIGLPGMDGYQVARRMRAETSREKLFIVAMSGYGEERHRRQSIEAGSDDHLVKPVQPDALRSFLKRVGTGSGHRPRE